MGAKSSVVKQKVERAQGTRMLSLEGLGMGWADVEKLLKKVQHLRTLDLKNNKLKGEVHAVVCGQTELKKLHLGQNKLESLSVSLRQLKDLEELSAEANHIAVVSTDGVMALPKLKKLDLSHNKIAAIATTPALKQLKEVDLSRNSLVAFPTALFTLPALVAVNLAHNRIADVAGSGLDGDGSGVACKNLQALDLSHNAIATLPAALFTATLLGNLNLDGNAGVQKGPELKKMIGADAYDAFMTRQKRTVDKQMQGGAVATLIKEK